MLLSGEACRWLAAMGAASSAPRDEVSPLLLLVLVCFLAAVLCVLAVELGSQLETGLGEGGGFSGGNSLVDQLM